MINVVMTVQTSSGGFLDWIVKYQDLVGIIGLFIPVIVIGTVFYIRTRMFSNTSKVVETNATDVSLKPSVNLVGIDEISNNMFINNYEDIYTGVIETTGIPYRTLSESEKDGVNSGYVGFLNTVNFPFSKHIISKKIDVELTENIYKVAYDKKIESLEIVKNELIPLVKIINDTEVPQDNDLKRYNSLLDKKRILEKDIEYLIVQMAYLDSTTTSIQGSTKAVYYSASGNLDEEALKGLSDEAILEAYENNVKDRLSAMSNSLANVGVKAKILNDIELLDLARLHYKPYTSNVFKTKHLLNETGVESSYSLSKEIFAKVKLHEALSKGVK